MFHLKGASNGVLEACYRGLKRRRLPHDALQFRSQLPVPREHGKEILDHAHQPQIAIDVHCCSYKS